MIRKKAIETFKIDAKCLLCTESQYISIDGSLKGLKIMFCSTGHLYVLEDDGNHGGSGGGGTDDTNMGGFDEAEKTIPDIDIGILKETTAQYNLGSKAILGRYRGGRI